MSIRNFKFWNLTPFSQSGPDTQTTTDKHDEQGNVVQLPLSAPANIAQTFASEATGSAQSDAQHVQKVNSPEGLMAAPELKAFFTSNFFGLGRHNGSHYKTQEAQTQGKAALVSQFDNAVAEVINQKQAKVDGLRNMELQTEGVCNTATRQLRLACTRLERDMATLQTQADLAKEGQGWVLAALNEYQIGFIKGLREAIDAEVLGL
jgi:hypothetical protein